MNELDLKAFLHHFCNNLREDKKYCFVLGSGASKQSGIPTGYNLVDTWLKEIIKMYGQEYVDEWFKKERIPKRNPAREYSKIYSKRFELDPKEGFSFLEQTMEGIEPSCGYSVLAKILETKSHKIVITTNFDSLIEDALFIYTRKKPLVVGHESLASFINPFGYRPVVIKIHRDLFLSPKNKVEETSLLDIAYKKNLSGIFKHYTPLIIGYGGNDGSLMGFLEELDEIEGGLFWFCLDRNKLSPRITKLINKHNGYLIEIDGFDEFFIQLGDQLKIDRMDNQLIEVAKKRADNYREQIETILNKSTNEDPTKEALEDIVERGEKDWWYYELTARKSNTNSDKESIYKKGLKELPDSKELFNYYAIFLEKRGRIDEAEEIYLKILNMDSKYRYAIRNYADLLFKHKNKAKTAEKYYLKAIEHNPEDSYNWSYYAGFLANIGHLEKASNLYLKAINLDKGNYFLTRKYASFLKKFTNEYDKADQFFQTTIKLKPNDANSLGSYALFLEDKLNRHDSAEEYYQKALTADPDNPNINGNYAKLLIIKKDFKNALKIIHRIFDKAEDRPSLLLELLLYRSVINYDKYSGDLDRIQELLKHGHISNFFDLSKIVSVAEELDHPKKETIKELAERITKTKKHPETSSG